MKFSWVVMLVAGIVGVQGSAPKLTVPSGGVAELEVRGRGGSVVTIEAGSEVNGSGWELLDSFAAPTEDVRVRDYWLMDQRARFYKVTESEVQPRYAPNFRLIDHFGKSRELHYHAHDEAIKALVLIFTGNGCEEVARQLPALRALSAEYGSKGVIFWMINAKQGDTRTMVAAEATRLGINWPILHDRAQTTARIYGVKRTPEVVVVERASMEVIYSGPVDDSLHEAPVREAYLSDVLARVMTGEGRQDRSRKTDGCEVNIPSQKINYATEIAPLLQAKCVTCHSPGNIAPWAMTSYEIVKDYAQAMLAEIAAGNMPPWQADPEFGRFKDDFSLTPDQERTLTEWLASGAPRGEGADPLLDVPPPPPKWPAELGEPDLILKTPLQTIKASGEEPYRYIFVPTGLSEAKWLRAAVVRPSNTAVVHHYLVWEGESMQQMASGLAAYVPGTVHVPFPEGTGVFLAANSSVTFNLHYTPTGEETTDQPELGLWFHSTPPAKRFQTLPLINQSFVIPPGEREFEVVAEVPFLPLSATLHGMSPHMHLRGARMKFEVVYPGGQRETLLSVPRYDFHWQTRFRLAEPKQIPVGSRIIVSGAFDNSELNHHNPDPGATVRWGDQSWEEMFIGYFDVTQN